MTGVPHGMCAMRPDKMNVDLLALIEQ